MYNILANQYAYLMHNIYLFLVIAFIVILVVFVLVRNMKIKLDNKKASIENKKAKVIKIQEKISAWDKKKVTRKYITFKLENNELLEFSIHPDLVEHISLNQVGMLTYQGSMYLDFQ